MRCNVECLHFKRKYTSCLQLLWAARLYTVYLFLFFAGFVLEKLLAVEATFYILNAWFLPAVIAIVIGRIATARVQDEREAALALSEFVSRRGYFCTVAQLTVEALILFGALTSATLFMGMWIPELYVRVVVFMTAFALIYSRLVNRELRKLKYEIECFDELKRAYEKIKF